MDKRENYVEEGSKLFLAFDELCQGATLGAIVAALTGMLAKILYHLPVDKREECLVNLEKTIREGIEQVPELEEALMQDGKQSDS